MKQTITAREMLAQIEIDFFKGADLAKASKLEGEEMARLELILEAGSVSSCLDEAGV